MRTGCGDPDFQRCVDVIEQTQIFAGQRARVCVRNRLERTLLTAPLLPVVYYFYSQLGRLPACSGIVSQRPTRVSAGSCHRVDRVRFSRCCLPLPAHGRRGPGWDARHVTLQSVVQSETLPRGSILAVVECARVFARTCVRHFLANDLIHNFTSHRKKEEAVTAFVVLKRSRTHNLLRSKNQVRLITGVTGLEELLIQLSTLPRQRTLDCGAVARSA